MDTSDQHTTFETDVPARGDAFVFHVTVDLQWRVVEPLTVVRRQLVNSERLLRAVRPATLSILRGVTRQFDVEQSDLAEIASNRQFENASLGAEFGFSIRVFVMLTQEEPTRSHANKVRDLARRVQIEHDSQRVHRARENNRRELLHDRTELYRKAIVAGDVEQFVLQLAENPSEISAVMAAVRADRDLGRGHAIDFFTQLSNSGLIDRHEVDDTVRATLTWLQDSIARILPDRAPSDLPQPRARIRTPAGPVAPPLPDGLTANGAQPGADVGATGATGATGVTGVTKRS